jgi:hypothetical protein
MGSQISNLFYEPENKNFLEKNKDNVVILITIILIVFVLSSPHFISKFFKNIWVVLFLVLFTMYYYTRDISKSLIITLFAIILVEVLFNNKNEETIEIIEEIDNVKETPWGKIKNGIRKILN